MNETSRSRYERPLRAATPVANLNVFICNIFLTRLCLWPFKHHLKKCLKMFSPESKVAKMTCPSCEHGFSSKGNLSQHFVYFPEHRLVAEPFLSFKEAVANFLDGDMSSYHRKARLRELFTKLSNEEMVELALPRLAKFLTLSGFLYEKKSSEIKKQSVKGSSVLYCKCM